MESTFEALPTRTSGREIHRRWPDEVKAQIISESLRPPADGERWRGSISWYCLQPRTQCLTSTLTAIVNGHKQSQIEDLLPWNCKAG